MQHPDFFDRNEALLALLRLPHARGSSTVSLMERQVEVLREKSQQLESKLAEFVAVARANEQLAEKIHRFTRRLLARATPPRCDRTDRAEPARGLRRIPVACWCCSVAARWTLRPTAS